jgi:hypothetical protein
MNHVAPRFLKKHHLGPQNGSGSSRPEKLLKIVNYQNCQKIVLEKVGEGGWPPISTWINPPSLGINGLHCIEFPGERGKQLLNMNLGELLALLEMSSCLVC